MRESQQQLQAIIDNSTAVIYVKDLQGRYLLINRRFEEIFHVSRTAIISLTDYDVFPKEAADSYRASDEQALAAGHPVESEGYALLEDGLHTYISIKCPLFDDNGQPYAVCGISTDITERKRAADRETRRRTWLEKVLQLSKDVAGARELQACLVAVYDSVRYGLEFDRAGLFLYDQNNTMVRGVIGTSRTGERDETDLPAVPVEQFSIFQEALKSSNWFQYTRDFTAENIAHDPDNPMYGVREHAAVAVWAGDRPVAALAVDNFLTGRPMIEEQLEALRLFAGYAGLAIENARLYSELQRELTERKQAEEALRQRDEQYRYVMLATRDAIYDWDRHTHTDSRNETYQMLYAPGEPVSADDTWWGRQIHPDDRERVLRGLDRAFLERQPIWSDEYRFRRFDGSYATVIDRGYILYDDAGEVVRMIGAMTDITERKRLEVALENERNLLRMLIDNLPHQIFFKDAQARFAILNMPHARVMGLDSPDQAVGKTVFDVFPPEVAARYYQDDLNALQHGQPLVNYEETRRDEQGNERWILTNKIPVRDAAGRITGLIGVVMDITEQHRLEEHRLELALARERADLLKDFLNTLSHDLKTPLSVINTSLYLLEKTTDPEGQKRRLDTIQEQAQRLEKLIQDIITMSRLDTVPDVAFAPLNVNQVIGLVREQVSTLAEGRGLTVDLHLDTGLPDVLANEEELARAIANLVENALRYSPPEGRVTVRSFRQDGQAVIEVQDTGIGIEAKDLPHIFDHFYRADRARATDTGGTGLGLAIVRRIIEMHHGSIEVESVPGEGSTFRVRLPIRENSH